MGDNFVLLRLVFFRVMYCIPRVRFIFVVSVLYFSRLSSTYRGYLVRVAFGVLLRYTHRGATHIMSLGICRDMGFIVQALCFVFCHARYVMVLVPTLCQQH